MTDTNSGGHGSPVGSVVFTDENGVAIGWGTLTATGDGVSSKATFSTTNLTATSGTPNCATPGSHHCITAQYMNDGSGQWTNSSTKITWQVFARPTTASPSALTPLVVGTTESLTATVTDAGPAPRQIQADASPVSGGQFFLANDGKPNPVKPTVFNLLTARYGAAAASLPSGNVVVIGGTDGSTVLSGTKSAELIGSGVTASAGSLAAARVFLTATTGNGGNVLIAGGSSDRCMSAADLKANGLTTNGVLGTLEKYFYQTDSFGAVSATPPTITARCGHAAVHLVSTNTTAFIGGYDANGAAMTSIEVFNPGGNGGNGTVTKVADLTTARAGAVAVLLQNGNILIAGGDAAGDAEIWDGVSATTTPAGGSMTVPRMFFGGDIMPDGNVLFAGGFSASDSSETALSSAEIYDVTTSTFGSITATLLNSTGAGPGKEMASVLVGIGAVGFAGGHDQNNAVLSTVQAYAPAYTPQGQVAFTGTSDSTDDLGGSGTPGPVACTLDVQNGTNTVACKTATTYYARHVNAGSHTVEADYLGNTNSAASTSTQAVTITPTPLMINAKDQPKVYGQTFSFLGTEFTLPSPTQLLPGDSVGSVTLTSTGAATTATYTSPGPAYDINITPGTVVFASGSAGDYSFTYGKGTMMLSQAPLTVKANDQAKPYGSSVTFSGNEFTTTPATLYNSDSVTSATLASGGAAGSATYVSPGPTYAITISNAVGSGLGNYNISYAPGTMTLSQAPLTLKANIRPSNTAIHSPSPETSSPRPARTITATR
ncbi:MAG TPA: MBG domain-containing protein [Terriglobales bacterium]|nr:MBG domain-containing protein [Terriglobales bacterium]